MDVQLILAGSLSMLAAAIHGVAGELLVVRRMSPELLPPTRLGGPAMTRAMIHASWHLATAAFLTAGVALLLAGTVLDGDAAEAAALLGAGATSACAAIVVGLGAAGARSARALYRHPGPVVLTATAALAWWGAL